MKIIKLKNIKINNFKGIKNLEVEFNDNETKIFAPNGSGKTSIKEAWEWVLGQNIEDFIPSLNNKEIPNLITIVEANIVVNDLEYSLKRENKPEYNREGIKTGNKGCFYIDNIEVTQSSYKGQITNIIGNCDLEMFPLLIDKEYFNTDSTKWKWNNRRNFLFKLSGANEESTKLINEEKYSDIKEYIIKGFNINDIKKVLTSDKKSLKEKQKNNQVLIESKQKELDEYLGIDFEKVSQDLSIAKQKYTKLVNAGKKENANEELDKLNDELLKLNQEVSAIKVRDVLKKKDLEDFKLKIYQEALQTKSEYDKQCANITQTKKNIEEQQNLHIKDHCTVCGQKLPEEKIKEVEDNIQDNIKTYQTNLETYKSQAKELYEKYNNLQAQYVEYEDKIKNFVPNEKINEFENKIRDLKTLISNKKQKDLKELSSEALKSLEIEISRLEAEKAKKDYLEKGYQQIKYWQADNGKLADEIIEIENKEILFQEFIREQTCIINDLVNSKFSNGVTWSLFSENYNGTLDEDCICLYNNKRYTSLSTGEKNVVNIEILKVIQNYFNVNMPIFADNEESVTINYDIDRQIIKFYANIPQSMDKNEFITIKANLFNEKGENNESITFNERNSKLWKIYLDKK